MRVPVIMCLIVCALGACTGIQKISVSELESRNLIGRWASQHGSKLDIYCTGAVSYEIKKPRAFLLGEAGNNSCTSCVVQEIEYNKILMGPMLKTELEVQKWPFSEAGQLKMIAEDMIWTRVETRACEKN